MTTAGLIVIGILQALLLLLAAPLFSGFVRLLRAKVQNRKGPPLVQNYRDIAEIDEAAGGRIRAGWMGFPPYTIHHDGKYAAFSYGDAYSGGPLSVRSGRRFDPGDLPFCTTALFLCGIRLRYGKHIWWDRRSP